MIPELGQLSLILAFTLSLVLAALPLLQKIARPAGIMGLSRLLTTLVFCMILSAFAALIASYAMSDFSVVVVAENSHEAMPMLYKIVSTWGNHEGSMLLWMLVLATCSFVVALLPAPDAELKSATLCVLGGISAGFLAFILFTSNPFLRLYPIPAHGADLNPVLQDIGLAFHPPLLYTGYVGFGIVFAYAIAGLWLNRLDAAWAKQVQPWIYLPWSALTLGIGAGSWWAYRTLGWGGFWFWDPVENVSLLPWLSGTALLHSCLVLEKRASLMRWVALLAILTFTMSLIGTFVVRSGLLTSVHSFAADPARGVFILAYILFISGGALLLFATRTIPPSPRIALSSRSGLILINNLLLVAGTLTVLIAILYPLFLQILHLPGVSVGEGYFNTSLLPMLAPLLPLAAIAPLLGWDRATPIQWRAQLSTIIPALALGIVIAIFSTHALIAIAGSILSCALFIGTFRYLYRNWSSLKFSPATLRIFATIAGHLGIAILVLGLTLVSTLKRSYDLPLDGAKPLQADEFTLQLTKAERLAEHTYISRRATFDLLENGKPIATLQPELRYFPLRHMQTSTVALSSSIRRDFYLVLGETAHAETTKSSIPLGVRFYVTPGQQLVWIGFALAALGGGFALLATFWRNMKSEHNV